MMFMKLYKALLFHRNMLKMNLRHSDSAQKQEITRRPERP